ncbi:MULTISPECIES: hypothetical protein [Vibrio harveyi group]|uniref:Uncharacterized protein n=1 Tax=Vibrio parahaemolyticus TaxID=670 RepID=A0AA47JEF4_VIBPH|nr:MULTISPECIES: hypothetical protein [Vibrio harveyi group]MCR9815457.1 hypothetical protein [Vibrio parahaemolyticus]MCR9910776.1 hypothetical protein [Vibrio campbellii]MDF4319577.1 hypothetical protein [Vibrio parahaemolyticus]MDG2998662.1 hypothetical protein [Vibrio parahaemolyticus]WAT89316.1 hypothetical protein O1Q84_11840 [Vibrio parahaemolyticus]
MTDKLKQFRSYRHLRTLSKVDKAIKERTSHDIELERTRNHFRRYHAREFLALR